jgi:hypothetical protein
LDVGSVAFKAMSTKKFFFSIICFYRVSNFVFLPYEPKHFGNSQVLF